LGPKRTKCESAPCSDHGGLVDDWEVLGEADGLLVDSQGWLLPTVDMVEDDVTSLNMSMSPTDAFLDNVSQQQCEQKAVKSDDAVVSESLC
jgi:hypothetical protein